MVLETILYFVLGFLSAALLALMVSPAIWNRAVALTKKRIESSVPLTLNEIQADKDRLRAEFAMSTRRLEMSVEALHKKAAVQSIELDRRHGQLNKLDIEARERESHVRELDRKLAEITEKLGEREGELSRLVGSRAKLEEECQGLRKEKRDLENALSTIKQSLNSSEIELSVKAATIETLKGTVSAFDTSGHGQAELIGELKLHTAQLKDQLDDAKTRALEAEKDLKAARKRLDSQAKEKNDRRGGDLEELGGVAELNAQLISEKAKTFDLEVKLAERMRQIAELLANASNENVQAGTEQQRSEFVGKPGTAASMRSEGSSFSSEREAITASTTQSWPDERREKAYLRERINDLAARVAVMTANLEGESSPVKALLEAEDAVFEMSELPTGSLGPSLAERIRAIQEEANSA